MARMRYFIYVAGPFGTTSLVEYPLQGAIPATSVAQSIWSYPFLSSVHPRSKLLTYCTRVFGRSVLRFTDKKARLLNADER
jgi:hypothetical protein